MWGRLQAELGEALRLEKKARSGDAAVVRGFVNVAVLKGDDAIGALLAKAERAFDERLAATVEALAAAREATDAAVAAAKGEMERHLQALRARMDDGLAQGEQVLSDVKAAAAKNSEGVEAQAVALREEASHHTGVMSTHKSKAEKEILRLQCEAALQAKGGYEGAVADIGALKKATEAAGRAEVATLERLRLAESRAQDARSGAVAAANGAAVDDALAGLRESSAAGAEAAAAVAAELDASRAERLGAAGAEAAKRDAKLAAQVNAWFAKARAAAKGVGGGRDRDEGAAKRQRDLAHARKVSERTAKEQRGSLLLGGGGGGGGESGATTPENVRVWEQALDGTLEVWASPEDAAVDRQQLVDACDAAERELEARSQRCWALVERRFRRMERESDGAAAARMRKMTGAFERHACAGAIDALALGVELRAATVRARDEQATASAEGFASLAARAEEGRAVAAERESAARDAADEAVEAALGSKVRAAKAKLDGAVLALAREVLQMPPEVVLV